MLPIYIFQFNERKDRLISTLTENDGKYWQITKDKPYVRKELRLNLVKCPGRYDDVIDLKETFRRELENTFMLELYFE